MKELCSLRFLEVWQFCVYSSVFFSLVVRLEDGLTTASRCPIRLLLVYILLLEQRSHQT